MYQRKKIEKSQCFLVCSLVTFNFFFISIDLGNTQETLTDQVSIIVSQGRLLGITGGEGIARIPLEAGEEVLKIESKGITGFVQTSSRLLGFSGIQQRWTEQGLEVSEEVINSTVTPRMVIVQGVRRLYGFLGEVGRWKVEDLRPRNDVNVVVVKDHVAVVATSREALGFSAFTGGFFKKDLPLNEGNPTIQANDNIIILSFKDKQLLFRARLAIWAEVR